MPCLLLLAAGRSRRLGRPKGGLVAHGVPLLVQQLQKARAAGIDRALVVLGASAPRLEKLLTPTLQRKLGFNELRICHASAWREGMGAWTPLGDWPARYAMACAPYPKTGGKCWCCW